MEKLFLWDTMKWWQVYCLRNQINVVWILADPQGAKEGGNMAGVKIERAEVRLVSNICVCVCARARVCVCVCVCVCEVGGGGCTSGKLCQVWRKHILFLFLLVFPPNIIL